MLFVLRSSRGKISFNTEYAYKYNDPLGGITYNNFAPGSALMTNFLILKRRYMLEAHRVDNMDYRSKRGGTEELTLNYIPAISKQHVYTLAAFYLPYYSAFRRIRVSRKSIFLKRKVN